MDVVSLFGYLVAFLLIVATAVGVWWIRLITSISLPGPPSVPFVGNLFELQPLPHHKLTEWSKKYGDFMCIMMGAVPTLVLSSPEILQETLREREQSKVFSDRWLNDFAKLSLHADEEGGKNVALANQKYWRKSRKIFVSELMRLSFIKQQLPLVRDEVHSAIASMIDLKGKPFDPHTYIQRLSLNIVMRLTYSKRFARDEVDVEGSDCTELLKVINAIVALGSTGVLANYIPIMKLFNGDIMKKRTDLIGARDKILLGFLEEHKKTLDPEKPRDFLDVLLAMQEEKELDDWEVTLIAWEFITAGTDTTSATMHWLVGLLANNPDIQKKAQAEIDSVCGDRPVSIEDQEQLPFTDACLKEAMRLYPVVPLMVPYSTSSDTTVRGVAIPKGTQVLVNQYAVARSEANWDNPDEFDPERFMCKEKDIELRGSDTTSECKFLKFIPMGTGRRACAGYNLAKIELFLQAAALIQTIEWSPPKGQDKVELQEKFGIAVSPKTYEICAKGRGKGVDLSSSIA